MIEYENQPTAKPDIETALGRAWRIPLAELGERGAPDYDACLANWLVQSSSLHPFYHFYVIMVIHLRPIKGVKEPNINFPGATHEILFAALDSIVPLPDLEDWGNSAQVARITFVHQFMVNDDKAAERLAELVVEYILETGISLDESNRYHWQDCVNNTAEHSRLGGHPDA